MKILSATDMNAADRRSVELGVPVATLMRQAGEAVARYCLRHHAGDGLIVALCGKGNNGGDGLVAARELARAGRSVRVVLLGRIAELKGDVQDALSSACKPGGVELVEIIDEVQLEQGLKDAALVIDAVVGTGFQPPLRGLAAKARDLLNPSAVTIIAVDVPSGWDADSMAKLQGSTDDPASQPFRASAVVTFAAPKLAHIFGHLTKGETFGPVVVGDISTPPAALLSTTGFSWAGDAKAIAELPRDVDGNKGRFGHVLVVGGSLGKAGAPSMASLAALRAGAGLVTAAVPREVLSTVAAAAPELMLTPLDAETSFGGLDPKLLLGDKLSGLLKGINVVALGPGLGQQGGTPEFIRTLVERCTLPMVIDADALNALADRMDTLRDVMQEAQRRGSPRTLVLTPHPGEMARLIGATVQEVEANRVRVARRFVLEYGVTLVLKGWRTLIASPDGRIAVNTTGNPAMAKAGSGDILTGIVAALLAQFATDKEGRVSDVDLVAKAVEAAVFLHGLAGDFATVAQEEHTVLATDTVTHLADAFRARVLDQDRLTWVTGLAASKEAKR